MVCSCMSDFDEQFVTSRIKALLDEKFGEGSSHHKHHDYIQMCIERERRRREMWEKVKTQVLGWGIIAMIGFLGKIAWDSWQHYLHNIHK